MLDFGKLIEQANALTPLPANVVRLAELVSHQEIHLQEVAELIAFDQALTVRLLRAANSAACGGAVPVTTVQEAVTRMGTAQVLALAVACGARPSLQTRLPAYDLAEGALWRHSVAAAVAAEIAPSFCKVEVPPGSFTAALLHDVGKLILGRSLSPEMLYYIRCAQDQDHLPELEAEETILGLNHGELGGLIAQHWKLPEGIIRGITFHHNPSQGQDVICDLTYLANQGAKGIEAGLDGRPFDFVILPDVAHRLGLSENDLAGFSPVAGSRFAQVQRRYNAV